MYLRSNTDGEVHLLRETSILYLSSCIEHGYYLFLGLVAAVK